MICIRWNRTRRLPRVRERFPLLSALQRTPSATKSHRSLCRRRSFLHPFPAAAISGTLYPACYAAGVHLARPAALEASRGTSQRLCATFRSSPDLRRRPRMEIHAQGRRRLNGDIYTDARLGRCHESLGVLPLADHCMGQRARGQPRRAESVPALGGSRNPDWCVGVPVWNMSWVRCTGICV
ncbi:hypothetical protein BD413DRAFT_84014 [Trametes elegans]|nr:hypothetical protein BD413DRAFT_84014 [Trametes elegans]